MSTELKNLISSLSEENFKKLIQAYLKEKYNTPHVRIVDGPYDGGNDIEIIIGDKDIKRNIQITVQKSGFESKLISDIAKASENVKNYKYQNTLDFYINQSISKDKSNELILKAEIDYGINLIVIDSTILEQESINFSSIRNFTYSSHQINNKTNTNIADKQTKILFDVLTLNHNSIEIKRNFINSYIFSYLYANPNSNLQEIFDYINPQLNETLDKNFLEKELNYLRSKKHLVSQIDKKKFILSEEKLSEIENVFSNVHAQEEQLKTIIDEFIKEKNIDCECDELIHLLYKLYQENYTIDIDEIKNTNNSFSASIKKTFNDLIHFFKKKGLDVNEASFASKKLLKICESNDFLNKLSIIHLFNNLYSSDKLEKYINSKNQTIFLDTQILIRMLCILYKEDFDFEDAALQSVKVLIKTLEKYRDRIKVYTSYDYIEEVAGHLLEAIQLQRFLKLSYVAKLGKSKNVFYNTYSDLIKKGVLDIDTEFIDFIQELLDKELIQFNHSEFIKYASERISEILEQCNIELIYHPNYQNYLSVKKEYEVSLAFNSRIRSNTAVDNDLRTILYLSTKENHINEETGEINEPFLITWDSAFYSFRKKLLSNHKEYSYWYIYSPLKVVDRFSVMNFNLNPKSISLNIMALTETNFNYSTKSTSFIDTISNFFNTDDVGKLSIINKLANLKISTRNIDEVPVSEEIKGDEVDTLTHLLLNIKNHYTSLETTHKFEDVIKVFEIPTFEDEIIKLLENTLINYKFGNDLNPMFQGFDNLIVSIKK